MIVENKFNILYFYVGDIFFFLKYVDLFSFIFM